MLTELCQELRNWFDRDLPKYFGKVIISGGQVQGIDLKPGQYFRVMGSLFNDGVHKFDAEEQLVDEEFSGAIWSMAVPPAVIALADEIAEWNTKYSEIVNSPYSSESFGGYTYSKASGASANGGNPAGVSWNEVFKSQLDRWRKI